MSLKSPSARLTRWSLQLQPYNLTIEYSPGKANVVADTLSRPPGVQSTEECHVGLISIEMPREKPEILRQKQLEDPEVKKIIDAYEHGTPEVVPANERKKILQEYHISPTAGHYGLDHTHHKVSRKFY